LTEPFCSSRMELLKLQFSLRSIQEHYCTDFHINTTPNRTDSRLKILGTLQNCLFV
jgi:hypothetical protein